MSSMSNAQQGTRGLSSADWTRLKRIKGAANLTSIIEANTDIGRNLSKPAVAAQVQYSPEFHSPRQGGTSRIRRTASTWTDFKAWNRFDYIIQQKATNNSTVLTGIRPCSCTGFNPVKKGVCITCSHPF
jgi:hypothetical protein